MIYKTAPTHAVIYYLEDISKVANANQLKLNECNKTLMLKCIATTTTIVLLCVYFNRTDITYKILRPAAHW